VTVLGAAFFACGPEDQLGKARRAESNDLDEQIAEAQSEFDAAISFLDDGDVGSWDGEFPADDAIADATDQCICGEADGGILGTMLACGDANAQLRQQLNDMRVLGAQVEGVGNAAQTEATRARDSAGTMVDTVIPMIRRLVTDAFNAGRINAAQRDQMMTDLTTAAGKFTEAKDKFATARTRAASCVSNAQTSATRAQEGLDALNQCPPDVATARAKARAAATAGRDSAQAGLDARDGIDQGRAKAAEGVPLVRGVLNALRP
jgi:hypothetical protein